MSNIIILVLQQKLHDMTAWTTSNYNSMVAYVHRKDKFLLQMHACTDACIYLYYVGKQSKYNDIDMEDGSVMSCLLSQ